MPQPLIDINLPYRSKIFGNTSMSGLLVYSVASKNSTLGLFAVFSQVIYNPQNTLLSFGCPSRIKALIFITARSSPQDEPAFDSLIPPVSGDFAPTEIRAAVGAGVPVTIPGEKTNLLFDPNGWHKGGTFSDTIVYVGARPAQYLYASGNFSSLYDWSFILTRRIHILYSFGLISDMPVYYF